MAKKLSASVGASILAVLRRCAGSNPTQSARVASGGRGSSAVLIDVPREERWRTNRALLVTVGDAMIASAAPAGGPVTLVVFQQGDMPELRAIFGQKAARALACRFEEQLTRMAGKTGFAVRTNESEWALLLPADCAEGAHWTTDSQLAQNVAIELDTGHEEVVLAPDFAVQMLEQRTHIQSAYDGARDKIKLERERESRRLDYLRAERESHCRRLHVSVPVEHRFRSELNTQTGGSCTSASETRTGSLSSVTFTRPSAPREPYRECERPQSAAASAALPRLFRIDSPFS